MARKLQNGVAWDLLILCSKARRGALVGAGLLGLLWNAGGPIAQAADLTPCPPPRLLATPVRFQDLLQLLNDPSREIRLEAISYLETLRRPAHETVRALMPLFNDSDYGVRVYAVRTAIRSGMPAQQGVPVVTEALLPEYAGVCCVAAQVLGEIGPPAREALPKLHACLTASPIWVRLQAARAAILIDPNDVASVPVLQAALESEQGETRDFAVNTLGEVVAGLTKQLNHVDPEVRRTAVVRLEQLGPVAASVTPELVNRLTDTNHLVRAHAARAAFRAGIPARSIIGTVIGLIDPERFDVLCVATSVLIEIGPEAHSALPKLHECLNSPTVEVRLHAGEAALRIDPTDQLALKKLKKALRHPQPDVRYFAVNSLGAAVMDSDLAAMALYRAISDHDPKVATAAALHLSRSHDLPRRRLPDDPIGSGNDADSAHGDVTPWIEALTNRKASVRQSAAICLAIAGPAARAAIPDLMDRLGDPSPVVRLYAAQALWEIDRNGYPIMPVLLDLLLTNRGDTRIGAIYTLGRMGNSASDTAPWLAKMLKNSKTVDRVLLAEAVLRIEPANKEALGLLVRSLHSRNAEVRYLSTVALGATPLAKKVSVEQALFAAIGDRSTRVRSAAYETLSQLQVRDTQARAKMAPTQSAVITTSATDARDR